jgi:predicted nuclease of predicted toxin-antitoxin system
VAALRLLADENVPGPSVAELRAAGHDVLWAAEAMPGAADAAVLGRAAAEGRVLVTLDRDFGELLFRRAADAAPAGVVYFRDVPPGPGHVAAVLLQLLGQPGVEFVGRFTVVGARTTRQRPLPSGDPGRHHRGG